MELSARLGSLMPYRKAADVIAEFLVDFGFNMRLALLFESKS